MPIADMHETFEKFSDDYLKFERIVNPLHRLPDLAAFLLLDKLVPGDKATDMVSAASHDEIYLSTDCDKLAEVATEDDILTLIRCGVRYDEEYECLCMFA